MDGDPLAVDGGVGIGLAPFVGSTWAALLRCSTRVSQAATLSSAPAVVAARVRFEWLPPDVAAGYCAKLPRTPPSAAAKRKKRVWLMALRSSRA